MARKVRSRWAASYCLLTGYIVMAVVTAVAIPAGATRRPGLALVLLAVAVFVLAVRAAVLTALGVAAIGWLCDAGFIVGRHGNLAWHGTTSLAAAVTLAGAALAGVAAGMLGSRPLPLARRERPARRPAPRLSRWPVPRLAHAPGGHVFHRG